ncbi:hypothetical protein ACIHAX_11790 [Nocardia sp. NPDC051929]|uniref:hypothetical protein n=1 Tax=unclassified Nocardia TaxID=2637762 RepID=UPI00342A7D9D
MGFFGIPWKDVAKFAVTTTATVAGGAVGSLIPIPGVGTTFGAMVGSFAAETLWDGISTGNWGDAASRGAESAAFSLLGGGAGGALRGAVATMGGRNLAARALSGAFSPAVATTRAVTGNAARGWLAGAGVAAGMSSFRPGAGPPPPKEPQAVPDKLPVRPAGVEYRGTSSAALVSP